MKDCLQVFKAMTSETRLKILFYLMDGEKCVSDIMEHVGRSQPTVSSHLARLEADGIVTSKREVKWVYYRIKSRRAMEILKTCNSIMRKE